MSIQESVKRCLDYILPIIEYKSKDWKYGITGFRMETDAQKIEFIFQHK
jgi:hypothetical protein